MIELKRPIGLKKLIIINGYTVSSFAKKIGVAPATLTIMFQSKKVSPRTAKLINEALKIDFEDVFEIRQREA